MPARTRRRVCIATTFLLAGSAMLAPIAPAAPAAPSCGDTITADATLTADVLGCPGDGLILGADGITLDLAGHKIEGDGIAGGHGILAEGRQHVTIKGGSVARFDFGVLLAGTRDAAIQRLTVTASASRGIQLQDGSDHNRIEGDRVLGSARSGIALFDSPHNTIRRNETIDNVLTGIRALNSDDNVIEDNVASGSGETINLVEGSDRNRVVGNTLSDGTVGVLIVTDVTHNVIQDNRIAQAAIGVAVEGTANTVRANHIAGLRGCGPDCEDCDDACATGVSVEGGAGNLVEANRIAHSTGTGIRVNDFGAFGGPHTIDTVIRDNLVRHAAADGIAVGTSADPSFDGGPVENTLLDHNTVLGSGLDGINVAKAPSTVTGNRALGSGRWGIQAVPGVTDGGGNHAAANGEPAQCLGIVC